MLRDAILPILMLIGVVALGAGILWALEHASSYRTMRDDPRANRRLRLWAAGSFVVGAVLLYQPGNVAVSSMIAVQGLFAAGQEFPARIRAALQLVALSILILALLSLTIGLPNAFHIAAGAGSRRLVQAAALS